MEPQEIQDIGLTLTELARPGITPKLLFDSVKARHPKAKRKDITRAALAMMIESAQTKPSVALLLQDFALSQRAVAEEE
ncbi:hypothetical protein V5F79_27580 [Xanthobacter flavus]|uniref:hypothetical protein n=1 Tax=Xanthobacter flavus TaxID=281 RepID=UPI003728129A